MLTPGLEGILAALRCPICAQPLAPDRMPAPQARSLTCAAGHSFDLARQGYVALLGPSVATSTADSTAMVSERETFLATGHYRQLAQAVAESIAPGVDGLCIDLGAGTGYHLAAVLDAHPALRGLALDLSAPAVQRAARAHPRMGAVRASVWGDIPVVDAAASVILSIFSPRNPAEIARMLAPGGILVVLTPTPAHLEELVGRLGLVTVDSQKPKRLETQLAGFERIQEEPVDYRIRIAHDVVTHLVAMGPSARHLDSETLAGRVATLDPLVDVTVSARVAVYASRE